MIPTRGCPIAKQLAIRLDLLAVDYKGKRLKAGEIFKIIARELRDVESSEANKLDLTLYGDEYENRKA